MIVYQIFMRIVWAVYQPFIKFLWGLYEQFINYLSNFYEDCMSSLSTICHYASLALQRNFLLVCFLMQLSWKEYPPWHIKEFHYHLNHNLIYTVYGNLQYKIDWGKVSSIFVSEIISISILPSIWSLSNSNLFLMEFMFKWANVNLLTLSLRIDFRVLSQKFSCPASNDTSELHSSKFLRDYF